MVVSSYNNILNLQQELPLQLLLINIILTYTGDSSTQDSVIIQMGISDHNLVHLCRILSLSKEPPGVISPYLADL